MDVARWVAVKARAALAHAGYHRNGCRGLLFTETLEYLGDPTPTLPPARLRSL
jgi:hypothetical protein